MELGKYLQLELPYTGETIDCHLIRKVKLVRNSWRRLNLVERLKELLGKKVATHYELLVEKGYNLGILVLEHDYLPRGWVESKDAVDFRKIG